METITLDQAAIVAGVVVSIVLAIVRRYWPGLDLAPRWTKMLTVAVTAALFGLAQAGWSVGAVDWSQVLQTWLAAAGTWELLGKPVSKDLNDIQYRAEIALTDEDREKLRKIRDGEE